MKKPLLAIVLCSVLLPAVPARAAGGQGQFVVRCPYSHTNTDDPIVFPGQPGASHMHDFFGNATADAGSTVASMLAGETTCRAASDTAGYWTPTPFLGDRQLQPTVMRIYYLGGGGDVQTIPQGLQVIGGNKLAQSPDENPHVRWYCGQTKGTKTPIEAAPYDCRPWAAYGFVDGVVAIIDLPSCWDGEGLTPEHVEYRSGAGCPPGFPYVLPRLSERLHLGIMNPMAPDGTVALSLSSGPYWTMHADFWNTWQQERLDDLVEQCLAAHVHCGSIDALAELDWTSEFGTSRYDLASAADVYATGVVVGGFTNLALPGETFRHRSDAFVRALRSDGGERWTTQFGGSGVDQVLALGVASDGVYVAGFTDGRLPKEQEAGGHDAFVARLGAGGDLRWIRQFGTRADEEATSLTVVPGGVVVGGWTTGSLQRGQRHGATDGFVARLSADGGLAWTRQFGTSGEDAVRGLASDGLALYAIGSTSGRLAGSSQGGLDGFVRRLTGTGRKVWTRQYGTDADDELTGGAMSAHQLVVTGWTAGTLPDQTASGGKDGFVVRVVRTGVTRWARQFGSPLDDEPAAIRANGDGIYVAGSTLGALGDQTLLGESDAFAVKYLWSGAATWVHQFGTNDYDRTYGAALADNALYVTGTTHGAFEGSSNAGDRDVFVTRIRFT